MQMKNLQHRVECNSTEEIKEFTLDGINYRILKQSENRHLIPNNLPMGVWMTGYARQYVAIDDMDGDVYEVYVYYYKAYESINWAVVDAIEKA